MIPLYNEIPPTLQCSAYTAFTSMCFPGLFISIYPFIKAWLNINHVLPGFGEFHCWLPARQFKHNFQCKHGFKCLITRCHAVINMNISQGTSACTPRQAAPHLISPQRHSEKTVSEQVCLNRLNICLLFHRRPGLLPVDN